MHLVTKSETLRKLQENCPWAKTDIDPVCLALFCQICKWLRTTGNSISKYKNETKVAERRELLNLHLHRKTKENNEDELAILKTFPIDLSWEFISCFVRDVVVPILIDDDWVLKCSDIFMSEEVFLCSLWILLEILRRSLKVTSDHLRGVSLPTRDRRAQSAT